MLKSPWTNTRAMISDPRPPPEATPVSGMSPPPVQPDVLCRCPSCAHRSLHALRLCGDGTLRYKFAEYVVPVEWSTSDPGAVTSSPLWHQLIPGVHESKRSPLLLREGLANDTMEYLEYRAIALKLPSVPPNNCIISPSLTMESDDSVEYLAYRASALVEVALSQDMIAPDPSQLARVSYCPLSPPRDPRTPHPVHGNTAHQVAENCELL